LKTQREGEREERQKKYEWNSMLVPMEAISTTTNFQFFVFALSLFLSLSLSSRLHHTTQTKEKEKEREKNAYSIFGIFKQVSVLSLSSMFVYSS
jgi:Trk-type K+ transport system membrane component